MRKNRGVSLVETVVTLLLLGLFIVIMSDLTKTIGQSQVLSKDHARSLEIATTILPQLQAEILAAVEVTVPSGPSATTLSLRTLPYAHTAAGASNRLLMPLPTALYGVPLPAHATWDVMNSTLLKTVLFNLQAGSLQRTYATSPPVALAQISSFQTALLPNRTYRLSLTTGVGERDMTVTGIVFKP